MGEQVAARFPKQTTMREHCFHIDAGFTSDLSPEEAPGLND